MSTIIDERFEELYDDHARSVLAYCKRRTGSADAQDALAEVFVVVWRRLNEVPAGSDARLWLYGVARRVLANQRRSTGRRLRLTQAVIGQRPRTGPAAEVVSLGHIEDQVVLQAILGLPRKDREVLTLIAWEGLSRAEAARVVGCSPEAAKKRFQRAAGRLRRELDRMNVAHDAGQRTQLDRRRSHQESDGRPMNVSRRAPKGGDR